MHIKPGQVATQFHPLSPEPDEVPATSRRRTGRSHAGSTSNGSRGQLNTGAGTGTKNNHDHTSPGGPKNHINNNYFALKAQLDAENSPANWDGSVRGYGTGRAEKEREREKEKRRSMDSNTASKVSSSL